MSEKKTVSVFNFIKRNLYYFLIGVSLIIIATVIAIVVATSNKNPDEGKTPESVLPPIESTPEESTPEESTPNQNENENGGNNSGGVEEDDKPVDTKIVFTMPVSSAQILKNYTSSTVVYNQTLGVYTGHMGIDFGAEAGMEVVSSYGGTVESITTSYLQGTTVTVDHGNGLKSVYNSIDAVESLTEGQRVSAGDLLGYVSDNNRQEYKDGPHLHFEVFLNGERVDPNDYLMLNEK
ncbi:MAG: M23 family metallopeptidase [Clostridiales bacterium]|nr:M23 family metallopeptidase [Clostridiales bacterium]